jgi:WD40 repeat protein/cytochrome c-type biogenesis protein CcmH/NrfG
MKIAFGYKHLFLLFAIISMASRASAQYLDTTRVASDATAHDEWATQVVFTPDGARVVSAGLDGRVRLVEAATGKLVREIKLPSGTAALCVAVSADGRYVAGGDSRGTVRIWEVTTGEQVREIKADKRAIHAVAFAEDGKAIAAGGDEGIARVWRLDEQSAKTPGTGGAAESSAVAAVELKVGGSAVSLAFVPGSELLAVGSLNRKEQSQSGVSVWRWKTKERARFFEGSPAVRSLAVSADGRLLAAGVFSPRTLTNIKTGAGGTFEASVRAIGEDDEAGSIGLWDLTAGKVINVFSSELGADSLAFSSDGQLLASGGEHGVMLFDTAIRLERGRIDTRTRVDSVAFERAGPRLAFARERVPSATLGAGGLDKLFDPFYVGDMMLAKDAIASGVVAIGNGGKSVTGGSAIEVWSVRARKSPEADRLWQAIQLNMTREDEARKSVEKIVADFPKFAEARRVLVVLSQQAGQSAEKLRPLAEDAVKADPNCAGCYRTLGDVRTASDDFAGAVESYRRALELNPESGIVAGRLASALNRRSLERLDPNDSQKMKEAFALLNEAMRLRPAEEQYITNLASLHYFEGKFDTSIELLKIAERLRPDHARLYYNLGHSYRQKGQIAEALRAYRRYVELGEPGEEARVERAKKIIEELSKKP